MYQQCISSNKNTIDALADKTITATTAKTLTFPYHFYGTLETGDDSLERFLLKKKKKNVIDLIFDFSETLLPCLSCFGLFDLISVFEAKGERNIPKGAKFSKLVLLKSSSSFSWP